MTVRCALTAAAGLVGLAFPAVGQTRLEVRSLGGELGFEFGSIWLTRPQQTDAARRDYWEWFEVGLSGAALDDRFLEFRARLRPTLRQSRAAGPLQFGDEDANQTGFDTGVDLLPAQPLSASFRAVRSRYTLRRESGLDTRARLTDVSGALRFRNPYLPASVTYISRSQDEYWRSGATDPVSRTLALQTARLSAENRKTAVLLEHNALAERNTAGDEARANRFALDRGQLRHRLTWGKASALTSLADYLRQTGTVAFRRIAWSEEAHLQHTRTTASDLAWRLGWLTTPTTAVQDRVLRGSLGGEVLPSLPVRFTALSQSTQYRGGREHLTELRPGADYRTELPLGVALTAAAFVGYERYSLEPTADGWVTVAREEHLLGPSGRFLLDNPSVDAASVTLTSWDATLGYVVGLDYELVELQPFLEVVALPGGRIAIGDSVVASYRYQVVPASRTDAVTGSYSVGLTIKGLQVYHRQTVRNARGNGATSSIAPAQPVGYRLSDLNQTVVGVRLLARTAGGLLDVGAERTALRLGGYNLTSSQARGAFTLGLAQTVRWGIGGTASSSNGTGGMLRMLSSNSTLGWTPIRSLQLRATLDFWRWTQEGRRQSRFAGGGLEARWQAGLTRVELRYDHRSWRDATDRLDDLLTVRLVRNFQ